jgi:hypothetical protein
MVEPPIIWMDWRSCVNYLSWLKHEPMCV